MTSLFLLDAARSSDCVFWFDVTGQLGKGRVGWRRGPLCDAVSAPGLPGADVCCPGGGAAGSARQVGRMTLAHVFFFRLCTEDSQVTSTLSPLQSPHKGLPPRPPSHNRPPPPQSLEGLRQMHYHRNDYDKSPIKPKMWSESSLDEPYEKVKKRSSHSHSR